MAKYAQYGDKKMDLGDLSLEKAKEIMARFFPELADPKVENKKDGEDTVYVFSKQAGKKGVITPSPWEVVPNKKHFSFSVVQRLSERSMNVVCDVWGTNTDERNANAQLIAAAPDLAEALRALAQFIEQYKSALIGNECRANEYERALQPALAALAKARGENQ